MSPAQTDDQAPGARNSGESAAELYENPYRGHHSYGPEDGEIFFGREADAERIVTMVLAHRASFLYAASGAGKTSLLAARIFRRLENCGWLPVSIRLNDDPLQSARQALIEQAVLHPKLELQCLEALIAWLDKGITLDAVARSFSDLLKSMPAKRQLLSMRKLDPDVDSSPLVLPLMARMARGGLSAADYLRALNFVASQGPGTPSIPSSLPLEQLREFLEEGTFRLGHDALMAELNDCPPGFFSIIKCLDSLSGVGDERQGLPVVLVFDQFEELFTRFADVDPSERGREIAQDAQDWRRRVALIQEMQRCFGPEVAAKDNSANSPHRLFVSLREDFVADLDALHGVSAIGSHNSIRMGFLEKDNAIEAIVEPALKYDSQVEPDCAQAVRSDLLREEKYVEPALLQVVCDRLWRESTPQPSPSRPDGSPRLQQRRLTLALYEKLGRAPEILSTHFRNQVRNLEPLLRSEVFDLLTPLITSNRTRNILEMNVLLHVPYRDMHLRRKAFEFLVEQRIVRAERRLRGIFVEIAHEFLIRSILAEIKECQSPEDEKLRRALTILVHRRDTETLGHRDETLQKREFQLLHEVRGRIVWDGPTRRLMFRSALAGGQSVDRETLFYWLRALSSESAPSISAVIAKLQADIQGESLSGAEWAILRASADEGLPDMVLSAILVRSAIRFCRGEADHDMLRRIVMKGHLNDGQHPGDAA